MQIFLGRQPILDINRNIVAYELLYRTGTINAFPSIDPDKATTGVIHHLFTTLGLNNIADGKKVFINFTRDILLSDLPDLGYKNVVIEVLENIPVDAALVDACKNLVQRGFTLALDDFQLDEHTRQLLSIASIVKIDWLADPPERIQEIVTLLKNYNLVLLAEKIETEQEFEQAIEMGFELFQGYFFSRPEIIEGKTIGPNTMTRLEILKAVNNSETGSGELAAIISKDVSLVFKLLKIINSSLYNLRNHVDSVEKAVVLLGLQEIKKWFAVIFVSDVNENRSDALIHMALCRAMFAQNIANKMKRHEIADELFLAGLFSLLDAMMGIPLKELVAELPVSEPIKEALVEKQGEFYPYIRLAEAYERSDVKTIDKLLGKFGLSDEESNVIYLNALFNTSVALGA